MKYSPLSSHLFSKNREKLKKELLPHSLVIVNSNDEMPRNGDQTFVFRQNSDLFYLSGIDQEKTILVLCPDHSDKKMREILFILKTNKQIEIWNGHKYTKKEAQDTSGIENVVWEEDFEPTLKTLMHDCDHVYLNLNENPRFSTVVPYKDVRFTARIKKDYPLHDYRRLAPILTRLRVKKEQEEIDIMQHACDITEKAFFRVLRYVKPGVMEYEIEAEITHEFIKNRASGHSYAPIIASGKNACVLHYLDNNQMCNEGDMLLMDFGCEYANYAADLSRTIPVSGRFSPRQRELYDATLRVMKRTKELMLPGITVNEYHEQTCKFWEDEHLRLGLYSEEDITNQNPDNPMWQKYYMHGTSHFLGLDVHDVGSKEWKLEPGMVLTLEPGIYIPEENVGIRLENDILITDDEPVDLMENIPIEPEEIEKFMRER